MPHLPFTAQAIKNIKPPAIGQVEYWDTAGKGFGLCAFPSGRKTWMLFYRTPEGRQRRLSLGTYPTISLADARKQAAAKLRAATLGEDPAQEKRGLRGSVSFSDLAKEYVERHAMPKKRSWQKDSQAIERDLNRHCAAGRPLISRARTSSKS
jgi:hypothetical protein